MKGGIRYGGLASSMGKMQGLFLWSVSLLISPHMLGQWVLIQSLLIITGSFSWDFALGYECRRTCTVKNTIYLMKWAMLFRMALETWHHWCLMAFHLIPVAWLMLDTSNVIILYSACTERYIMGEWIWHTALRREGVEQCDSAKELSLMSVLINPREQGPARPWWCSYYIKP